MYALTIAVVVLSIAAIIGLIRAVGHTAVWDSSYKEKSEQGRLAAQAGTSWLLLACILTALISTVWALRSSLEEQMIECAIHDRTTELERTK